MEIGSRAHRAAVQDFRDPASARSTEYGKYCTKFTNVQPGLEKNKGQIKKNYP